METKQQDEQNRLNAALQTARDVKAYFDEAHHDHGMGVARQLAALPPEQRGSAIHDLPEAARKALFDLVAKIDALAAKQQAKLERQ